MKDNMIKHKDKKDIIFICSIADGILQVAKCVRGSGNFLGLEAKRISPSLRLWLLEARPQEASPEDKKITGELAAIFNKLGYNGNPIILSLPRAQCTCRYLKIPSLIPEEIERIVHLQAPRYLPYQEHELVTGYQEILIDKLEGSGLAPSGQSHKDGLSDISLVIAQRNLIESGLKIFMGLKPVKITILMSSYGLCNLYNYVSPQGATQTAVMAVTFDAGMVEMAVILNKKLVFSRSARVNGLEPHQEDSFIMELRKTRDAYAKDVPGKPLSKIVFLLENADSQKILRNVSKGLDLPVETVLYGEKIGLPQEILKTISTFGSSFTSLLGLGIEALPDSLNLLPLEIKEENKARILYKERLRMVFFISGLILITGLGMMKSLNNKAKYLEKFKVELSKITDAAKPLEEKDSRILMLESRLKKETAIADIIYELGQILPSKVSLINFAYEENSQMILRGQAAELNSVFMFAAELEKSAMFKNFSIKVRYATKKKTQGSGSVDFEIACQKNNAKNT